MARAPSKARKKAEVVKAVTVEHAPPPLSLDEVLGQARAVGLLREAMASGRVHHAWVFHGPPGVGKFLTARAFAAELLTPKGTGSEAARVRELLAAGRHADLRIVNKELASISSDDRTRRTKQTTIGVEIVREFLVNPAGLAPLMYAGTIASKVFIVDEADLLAPASQDAMLKTLEEPPEGTVVILVTADEHALQATVRSRCQRVAFSALDPRAMQAWLQTQAEAPGPGPERDWLLLHAAGSPGRFVSGVRNRLFEWQKVIEPMLQNLDRPGGAAPGLGVAMGKLVEERAAEQASASKFASKDTANRHWAGVMMGLVMERARKRLSAAATPAAARQALRVIELVSEAEGQLDSNVAFASVLENLAAQMGESSLEAAAR
ncbi:MAG: AAA family ATPase [Phycisphaeraceae bacterium]|nr:AAA family ATPase [Phycisphaeraceae bacterium]